MHFFLCLLSKSFGLFFLPQVLFKVTNTVLDTQIAASKWKTGACLHSFINNLFIILRNAAELTWNFQNTTEEFNKTTLGINMGGCRLYDK